MNKLVPNSQTSLGPSLETFELPNPCDHLDYRGYSLDFYEDPLGSQIYTIWRGKRLNFGSDNFGYKTDMRWIIDRAEDLITKFSLDPRLRGAELSWFNNGGSRDVRLTYQGRILKVYLVAGPIDETFLISDARDVLDHFLRIQTPEK